MKRYIAFFTVLATIFSCAEKNTYEEIVLPTVDVTAGADLAFKAIGGTGSIEIAPLEGQLQATTDQSSWCHISVSGNKIDVTVDSYEGLESRYAVINMTAGKATGKTIVQQFGLIVKGYSWKDITVKNKAQDITFPYDADETPVEPTCSADWITFSVTPDKLVAHVNENAAKEYREAEVLWKLGSLTGSFTIGQFDMADAGLLGAWEWHGYHNGKTDYPMEATLSETGDGLYNLKMNYSSSTSSTTITIDLDVDGLYLERDRLMLPLGSYAGTYTTKNNRTGATTTYYAFPLYASGTARLQYKDAVIDGALPLVIGKNDQGGWQAVADPDAYPSMTFRFEMWDNTDHEGTSRSGLILSDISMVKQ